MTKESVLPHMAPQNGAEKRIFLDPRSTVSRDSAVPLYLQVQAALAAAAAGAPHGTKLPSEYETADHFHVSRHIVRQAFARLATEGRVIRRHGAGYFVNNRRYRRRLPAIVGFTDALSSLGVDVRHEIIVAEEIDVSGTLTRLTSDDDGGRALRVLRMAMADGETVAQLEGYYPMNLGQRLDIDRIATDGVYRQFAAMGVRPHTSDSVLSIEYVDGEVAHQLGVAPGHAVYRVESWTVDMAGRYLEHSRELDRADRFEFSFTASAMPSMVLGLETADTPAVSSVTAPDAHQPTHESERS